MVREKAGVVIKVTNSLYCSPVKAHNWITANCAKAEKAENTIKLKDGTVVPQWIAGIHNF